MRAHGVRGELRVHCESGDVASLAEVLIGERLYSVASVRPERSDFLLRLQGVDDRDQAELLRGKPLFAERSALPPLRSGEFFLVDLVGCDVFDVSGKLLGQITSTFFSGAHEVLVVRGEREFMLPLVDEMVRQVDIAQRRLICDPPAGLIDLG